MCCFSWSDWLFACIIEGAIFGFGVALLIETTKRVILQGHSLTVLWLGCIHTQRYMLEQEIYIKFERRENLRYGVTERLKIRQGHSQCVIPSVMNGFETFCMHLREVF